MMNLRNVKMMNKEYWFSYYNELSGKQDGCTLSAKNDDDAVNKFYKAHPECGIADYGCCED